MYQHNKHLVCEKLGFGVHHYYDVSLLERINFLIMGESGKRHEILI